MGRNQESSKRIRNIKENLYTELLRDFYRIYLWNEFLGYNKAPENIVVFFIVFLKKFIYYVIFDTICSNVSE